jgi:hypothetical protein
MATMLEISIIDQHFASLPRIDEKSTPIHNKLDEIKINLDEKKQDEENKEDDWENDNVPNGKYVPMVIKVKPLVRIEDLDLTPAKSIPNEPRFVSELMDINTIMKWEQKIMSSYEKDVLLGDEISPAMFPILTDWILLVCGAFKFTSDSFYGYFDILHKYLLKRTVKRDDLQKYGLAALLISAKISEIYACEVNDLVYICSQKYNKQQIINAELEIMIAIDWKATSPNHRIFQLQYCQFPESSCSLDDTQHRYMWFKVLSGHKSLDSYQFNLVPSITSKIIKFIMDGNLEYLLEDQSTLFPQRSDLIEAHFEYIVKIMNIDRKEEGIISFSRCSEKRRKSCVEQVNSAYFEFSCKIFSDLM